MSPLTRGIPVAIPVVDLPFYHTPPRWETVLSGTFSVLSLSFCKLSSTPCWAHPISSGESSSTTERFDAVYKPTAGTFVYSPVTLAEYPILALSGISVPFSNTHLSEYTGPSSGRLKRPFTSSFSWKTKLLGHRFLQDFFSWINFSKAWLRTCIWRLANFESSRKDATVLNVFPWYQAFRSRCYKLSL